MQTEKVAKAGTLESNDALILISPGQVGQVEIEVDSIVMQQFGEQIREIVTEEAKNLQLENVKIQVEDRGALDCTLRARLKTAANRMKD